MPFTRMRLEKGPWALVVFATLASLSIAGAVMLGVGPTTHWFVDTDDFTRAGRVLQLMEVGSWWDPVLHKVGAAGLEMHWTRPSDGVVLLGALPLHWLGLPAQRAIEWSSAVSPVALLLAFCFAWRWAISPLVRTGDALPYLVMAPMALWIMASWFMPMRIDHHGLIVNIAVLMLGFSIRSVRGELGWRGAAFAGALAAGAIWVSVEELLFVGCLFAAFGLAWAVFGGAKRLLAGTAAAVGAAAFSLVFLVVERGAAIGGEDAFEIDRISLFHVTLLAAVAAGWAVILVAARTARSHCGGLGHRAMLCRGSIGALGGGLAGMVVYLLQPQVFDGHVATAVDMSYVAMRAGFIREGLEVLSPSVLAAGGWDAIARVLVGELLIATVGFVLLVWLSILALQGRGNRGWLAIAIWVAVFVAWQGWPTNANLVWLNLFGAAPAAIGVCMLVERLISERLRLAWGALMIAGLGIAQVGFANPNNGTIDADRAEILDAADASRLAACSAKVVTRELAGAGIGAGDVVMAYPDFGPAIMWSTGAGVLSIPNHRIQPGFRQSVDTFKAGSDREALGIIEATSTSAIVLCDAYASAPFFGVGKADGDTFGRRLMERRAADWLREIPISDPSAADARIYLVERPR